MRTDDCRLKTMHEFLEKDGCLFTGIEVVPRGS